MLGEKKRFYILTQQISRNRACMYALASMYALCCNITVVFREKQYIEKLPHGSLWYDEKVVFLIAYIDTHQKSSCLSEIYVSVDNICSNKLWRNAEERFYLEILSWGQRSGNKNKPPFND